MNFEELTAWVDEALQRVRSRVAKQKKRAHVQRLYDMLTADGEPSQRNWLDWHALAVKCAELLGEDPPAPPAAELLVKARAGRKKKETPKHKKKQKDGRWGGRRSHETPPPARRSTGRRVLQTAPVLDVSAEFRAGLEAIRSGTPLLFVTGRAGTGKSTFIRYVRNELTGRKLAVIAPTGIAALNAGGQTIHSFFRFPPKLLTPQDVRTLDDSTVLEQIEILVIDEISMVRADVLDAVDESLRLHRGNRTPFGGVQMVLVGDLFQLPPVVTRDELPEMSRRYTSPFFFGARALQTIESSAIELTRVYRQEDRDFVRILGSIREGRDAREAVAAINRSCSGRRPEGPHLMLVTRNDAADRENSARLAALPGKPFAFEAVLAGEFPSDRLPAPRHLVLKKDTRVMFTRNDPQGRWVNGTTGIVRTIRSDAATVLLDKGVEEEVKAETWETVRWEFDADLDMILPEVVGSYTQLPLMPAWAVTIHKAQGLTLDAVHVDFGAGAFAEGQAYVALSRCRRMSDLTLERPLRMSDVRCSEEIRTFYRRLRSVITGAVKRIVAWDVTGAEDPARVASRIAESQADLAILIGAGEGVTRLNESLQFPFLQTTGSITVLSRVDLRRSDASVRLPEPYFEAVDVAGFIVVAAAFPRGEEKRTAWDLLLEGGPTDRPALLAGNLNTGAHLLDEEGATMLCADAFASLPSHGWIDVWRTLHRSGREYSWLNRRGRGFRTTHAFATDAFQSLIRDCHYVHATRESGESEHSMIVIDLD